MQTNNPIPGHELCNQLKALRRLIADKVGVQLQIPECTNINPCAGTCLQCENELKQLDVACKNLPPDLISGIGKTLFGGFTSTDVQTKRDDLVNQLVGKYQWFDSKIEAPFFGIKRHSVNLDGDGVCTLALFHGCTLRCRYCLNPQSFENDTVVLPLSPDELLDIVKVDHLYFVSTGGGVTFGGGEPLLNSEFIKEFRRICPPQWRINVQTSLNVDFKIVESLINSVDKFIVDIKDINPDIYLTYTNGENSDVCNNLVHLSSLGLQNKITMRVPSIKGFNTSDDIEQTLVWLHKNGFNTIDCFEYKIPSQPIENLDPKTNILDELEGLPF